MRNAIRFRAAAMAAGSLLLLSLCPLRSPAQTKPGEQDQPQGLMRWFDPSTAPFVDAGEVFAHSGGLPVNHLHKVAGIGFRGIANPFVVGYVDLGYGNEGVAAFTGINYPF